MEWYWPYAFVLLFILPPLAFFMLRQRRTAAVRFSSLSELKRCPGSWRLRFRPVLIVLRLLCLVFLIVAIARPREGTAISEVSTEAVALEVVVDRSSSMSMKMDYFGRKLDRLAVVKEVFTDFVAGDEKEMTGRKGDIIGLITFAGYADTVCPLVTNHDILLEFLKGTQIVEIQSEDGTAIGDAIALAAARLKKSERHILQRRAKILTGQADPNELTDKDFKIKSKAVILLTDGIHNTGKYTPMQATELARQWGIKIYTIGIGSAGMYLDERLLNTIAERTGGFYGRAGDAEALGRIVEKIDQLEKTDIKSVQYVEYAEYFGPWALMALLMLALEMLGSCTILKKIP